MFKEWRNRATGACVVVSHWSTDCRLLLLTTILTTLPGLHFLANIGIFFVMSLTFGSLFSLGSSVLFFVAIVANSKTTNANQRMHNFMLSRLVVLTRFLMRQRDVTDSRLDLRLILKKNPKYSSISINGTSRMQWSIYSLSVIRLQGWFFFGLSFAVLLIR